MSVPEAVRRQAVHPLLTLPPPVGFEVRDGRWCHVALHQIRVPQMVEARAGLQPGDVDAAIAEARQIVRDYGREAMVWFTTPDHPWLAEALAERGLANQDSPGFEAVENAMALVDPPAGAGGDDVEVRHVDTFEAYVDGIRAEEEAFDIPAEERAKTEATLPDRWEEYRVDERHRRYNAYLDGHVAGTGVASFGDAGLNLFGGSVLPGARGRGVYRALVRARWEVAVSRGTPALTVQAGRMSAPILAGLGFEHVAAMPTYYDELT